MEHEGHTTDGIPRGRMLLGLAAVAACALVLGPPAAPAPERVLHGRVTVTKLGDGEGRVTSSPDGIDCGSRCTFNFVSDEDPAYVPVTLTASAEAGSAFEGFGECGSTSCTIDPVERNASYEVYARFTRVQPSQFPLTVGVTGQGKVTSAPGGIDCGAACSANFAAASTVALTAVAVPGWTFSGWGGACSGTGSCSVTMNGPASVTATFAPPDTVFTLAVATAGGTVTSDVPGIDCGTACVAAFGAGVPVTLTPASGGVAWSGACTGAQGCVVPMAGPRAVSASFGGAPLSGAPVAVGLSGRGIVSSTPGGIECGTSCGGVFPLGGSLTLRAAAADGWVFAGWADACIGVALMCTVAPRGPTTVLANFVEAGTRFPVAVTKAGQGTVSSRPPGIACGAQCSATFGAGGTVTLEAEPRKGWTFVRWSGACSGGKPVCALGMDGPKAASATFGRPSDRTAPKVKALPGSGSRGETVRLRYRVSDASRRSRETAIVYAGSRKLATIRGTEHAIDAGALFYFVPWRRAAAAATRFCITSIDPTGNVSKPSCAPLRIS